MKRVFFYLLLISIFFISNCFVGCVVSNDDDDKKNTENEKEENTVSEVVLVGKYNDVLFFDDENYGEDILSEEIVSPKVVSITYNEDTVDVVNPCEDSEVSVMCNGGNVIINANSDDFIVYELSGSSENGNFRFYSKKKYKLVLNNLRLKSTSGPAINIQSKKRGFIDICGSCSLEDTANGYSSANEDEDAKGTIFSEGQLIFDGDGTLSVTGNEKHAIGNDEYIRWNNATLEIVSAAKDGIHVNDLIIVNSGNIIVKNAGKNAIECEKGAIVFTGGDIKVNSTNDAIKASYTGGKSGINPYIIISNTLVEITTNDKEKAHGINTESSVVIKDNSSISINVTGDASKGIKSGGLIAVGSNSEDETYISITVNGGYVAEEDGYAEPVGIKAGTTYRQSSGHVRINNLGACGRGIAASGNMEISNCKIYSTLHGDCFTRDENADYNGYPKALKVKGSLVVSDSEIVIDSKYGKGLSAEDFIKIKSGDFFIKTGHEGIESETVVNIEGGNIYVYAGDDAVNAGGGFGESKAINVTGGYVYAESSCDVFDSNGYINFNGGICVLVRTQDGGDSVIDPGDNLSGKGIRFNGGTVLAVGSVNDMWIQDIAKKYTGDNVIINNSGISFKNLAAISSDGTTLLSYYNGTAENAGVLYASDSLAKIYKDVTVENIEYSYNYEKYADKGSVSDLGTEIVHSIVENSGSGKMPPR